MDIAMISASRPNNEPNPRAVGVWLLCVCACVLAMILVGGATRLTDSGLSITEWDLGKGLTPPLSAARWAEEFALYQRTTEYRMQNRGMSLAAFQSIYWWEWGHRFLGKMIGLVFALPFVFFWARGHLKARFWPVFALFCLGGLQGFVGWWMVTSGLFSGLDVSPVRLAIHLGLAFAILGYGFWLALDALAWPREKSKLGAPRWAPFALMGLMFVQVIFGALLAGADGGPAYADWPLIGGEAIPAASFTLQPWWRNFIAEHATQHLLHRSLGYIVAGAALGLAALAWRRGEGLARRLAIRLGALALIQVALGVGTVLTATMAHWALAHQFVAALLWLSAVATARAGWR
jgi:heme a synthase